MRGRFIIPDNSLIPAAIVPNTLTDDGESEYLKMIFQADVATIASGGNFYLGLTNLTPSDTTTFADALAGEPTIGVNGYARAAITRDATGWPTVSAVGGETSIRSTIQNFTASGGDFDVAITRAFLCSAATGSTGKLFSISSAIGTAFTVTDGSTLPIGYEAYLY